MRLLIDGYNLLHATDLFGAGELAGTLRGSREALIGFLSERLTSAERGVTVIVFDAADAPPGLADRYEHDGIDIRFARNHADADAMIEALLEGVHRAKHLTVVSGDRRVQRAARSSGAVWIDSDVWFAELRCRPRADDAAMKRPSAKADDTTHWVREFSDAEALAEIERQAAAAPLPLPAPPSALDPAPGEPSEPPPKKKTAKKKRRPPLSCAGDKPAGGFGAGLDVFPPGYAEDLLDGRSDSDGDPGRPGRRRDE